MCVFLCVHLSIGRDAPPPLSPPYTAVTLSALSCDNFFASASCDHTTEQNKKMEKSEE